jgi:hypothetical protein
MHKTSSVALSVANGGKQMRLAIWSTTTPRENSTHQELFRRQLDEAELAERIGIDQMWFLEHHLQPSATPLPNLMIAAASHELLDFCHRMKSFTPPASGRATLAQTDEQRSRSKGCDFFYRP